MVTVPKVRSSCEHAYHQYLVRSKRRDELVLQLQQAGIPATVPVRHHPALAASFRWHSSAARKRPGGR